MGGLFLFLVFTYFLPSLARYQNPTRQYLIKSVGSGSDSLNADAANFLSGFSRGSHPNRLGKVDTSEIHGPSVLVWWSSDSSSGETKDYFEGIIGISIACIFFACLSLATCCGFCLGRCGWNSLGGRHPTPKKIRYLPKHIYMLTAGIFVVGGFMIILFAVALTSNTDVSSSEDATLAAVEGFENYLWEYMGPLNSLLNLSTTGLNIAQGMNSLIFSTLPTTATLNASNQCLMTSYSVFQLQDAVSSDLVNINNLIHTTVNFTTFAALFSQLSSTMAATPSLTTYDTTAKRANVSIGTLPSVPPMVGWVGDLDTDLDTLTTMNPTISTLNDLRVAISGLGLTSLISTLADYETSVAALPDLQLILDKINGVQPNTQDDMQANLTALANALAIMPDPTAIGDTLTALDPVLAQIETDAAVESNLTAIQTVLNDLSFLPSLISSLQQLQNVRSAVQNNVSLLLTSSAPIYNSFFNVDDFASQMLPLISATETATNQLASAISGGIVSDMKTLQVNLPTINCLNNVYNQLYAINNSLFILPSSVNPFFQQRPIIQAEIVVLANLTQDINATANALTAVNNSLTSFPNFTVLTTQLQNLVTAVSNADIGQLILDLRPLNQSLSNLPPLPAIISSLQTLDSSRNIPTLATTITSIQQIATDLSTFPDLAPYISSFYNIGEAKTVIELDISDANASVSLSGDVGASYVPTLNYGISSLMTNISSQPSISTLSTDLSDLNTDVSAVPNLATVSTQLTTVQTNANNVPNVDVLNTNIQLLDSSLPQSTLTALITGNPDIIQSAGTLYTSYTPAFLTQSAAMTTTQDSLNQFNVNFFLSVTNGSSTWLTAGTVSAVSQTLDDVTDSRDELLVFNDTVSNLSLSVDGLQHQINNFTDQRYSFDSDKNSAYNQVQNWDLVRLFMAFFLVALPVLVLGFGVIASLFKKPCFSMVMALSSFGIIALFFFIAGTQVPLATFMSDQCSDPNAFIEAQLNGEEISATSFFEKTGIKVTENVSLLATYNYLFNCEGPEPEFLVLLDDPAKLINDTTQYNFTTLRTDIIAASGGLVLNPALYSQFDVLNGLVNEAVVVIDNAMDNLVQCEQIQELQATAIDAVCVQFAGAFALNTCLYALFAICISPALCLGVKGYKMFNPYYRAKPEDEERQRQEKAQEKEPIKMTKKAVQQSNRQPEGHGRTVSHLPPGAIRKEGGAVFIPDSPQKLWICPTCTYHNQPSVVICQVCGAPREEQSQMVHSQSIEGASGHDSGFFIEPVNENPGAIDLGGGAILVPVHDDEHK